MNPKVGLALGSGGARGWAHLGALRRLDELGFKPHCICGASIGALVGAIYSAGHFQALEQVAATFGWRNWADLFLDPAFIAPGLLAGDRVVDFLRRPDLLGDGTLCEIPFSAAATNLQTGLPHHFPPETNALDAVRASIAIPVVFSPHTVDGQIYIDGGLTDPLPIDACRLLGAERVVAIDINLNAALSDTPTAQDERPSPWHRLMEKVLPHPFADSTTPATLFRVMSATVRLMENVVSRSAIALQHPDVLIQPAVGQFHMLAFKEARLPAIQAGYDAVCAAEPRLRDHGIIA